MPFCFEWRISHFGAASKASSCVCASLSLPCPVRQPAVAMGRACRSIRSFVARPLVLPWLEFWRTGVLCWSPVRFTLRQLKSSRSSSTRSEVVVSGFLPPTAGRSFIGGTSACSGPFLQVTAISLAFGLATAVFRCGGRVHARVLMVTCLPPPSGVADGAVSYTLNALCINRKFISSQSWPLLDFPLCGFSAGLCRSSLASPSRCLSEFAPALHRLISPPLWLCLVERI